MKNSFILGAVACGFFLGCGDYNGGEQTARNDNGEAPNFGSATDITPTHGNSLDTNNLNVADTGLGGTPQRQTGNYQSQVMPGQTSDQELAKQIKVALTTGSVGTTGAIAEDQLTKIDVEVQDGAVTLRGAAASEQEKRTIEKRVAGMKGVKSVRNELTVGARSVEDKAIQHLLPRGPGDE